MDLKIKEVSQLLGVSETTIRRWVAKGLIPAYKLNAQLRFSRNEIDNWVLSQKVGKKSLPSEEMVSLESDTTKKILSNKMGTQAFSLYRAIHRGGVYTNIPGKSKEEIIKNGVEKIACHLSLDAEVLTELLLDRERLMPTGLNHGIAVPHTRDFLLPKSFDVISVVYPQEAIEYGSLDGKKVHTLFFLFASSDKRHLHLLAKLAHLTMGQENLAFFEKKPEKHLLLSYIKDWEMKIRPLMESPLGC